MLSTPNKKQFLCIPKLLQPPALRWAVVFRTPFCRQIARRTMATAMAKRLEGKTIVITGASSGIGKSTGLNAISQLHAHQR